MKFFDRPHHKVVNRKEIDHANRDAFNDIATKISEALPEPARKMQAQFKQQAEDLIAQGLKDLNVAQRRYDKQTEKVSKAEAKLAELETRLAH